MSDSANLKPVTSFLSKLAKNNDRPWFEAHRADYEEARQQFERFVGELIEGIGAFENLRGLMPKDCIMRIYRDIRFSKDKSPYKTGMGASIGAGGKKQYRFHYYLHIQPGGKSMVAGGLHEPEPAQLRAFRTAISRDARPFKAIVTARPFRQYFGEVQGEKLKTAPQGYDKEHPEIDLLRMKEVLAMHRLGDDKLLSAGLSAHVVSVCAAMKPFLDYLRRVAG